MSKIKKMKYKEGFEEEYFKKPKSKSKPQKNFVRKDKIKGEDYEND